MASSLFQRPVNNFSSTLSAQHTSGSGTLALQAGDGTLLGALGSSEVYRVTVVSNPGASETIVGIFEATGLSTNTLTGVTAVEGFADSTIAAGTTVQVRVTAKTLSDIHAALHNLELTTEIAITGGVTLSTYGKNWVCSGTSADYTVVLPTAVGHAGEYLALRMSSALTKLVTLDGNASETIDGALTRILWAGESCTLLSDGANWTKVAGKSKAMICAMRLASGTPSSAQNISTGGTPTKVLVNQADVDTTGLMADTGNNRITIKRPGYYMVIATVTWSGATAVNRAITQVYKNAAGTSVVTEQVVRPTTSSFAAPTAVGVLNLAVADVIDVRAFQDSGAGINLYGDPSATTCVIEAVEQPQW